MPNASSTFNTNISLSFENLRKQLCKPWYFPQPVQCMTKGNKKAENDYCNKFLLRNDCRLDNLHIKLVHCRKAAVGKYFLLWLQSLGTYNWLNWCYFYCHYCGPISRFSSPNNTKLLQVCDSWDKPQKALLPSQWPPTFYCASDIWRYHRREREKDWHKTGSDKDS